MSERWKYQLKMGGFWGVFMTVFMTLFDLKEKPLMEQITSYNFYLRAVVYIAVGVFVLGYFNWKQMQKNKS
ncbi:MAG: hypothetical protein JNJ52_05920 [Flavobacterium sp.]|nr:hypothetical protein [Flavobacterium sp.]